jgi:hypothetical protein
LVFLEEWLMSAAEPGKTGRRTRTTKAPLATGAADQSTGLNTPMAEQEKSTETTEKATSTDKGQNGRPEVTALSLKTEPESSSQSALQLRSSEDSSEIEVVEQFSEAGLRPIAASHLPIYGTILNNRPIMASNLKVVDTSPVGNRPIFASDLVVRDDLTLPGGRPVFASDPHLLEATQLPGGRPIASNDLGEAQALMGYID